MPRTNPHGQPIGPALPDWQAAAAPEPVVLAGQYVRLEPVAIEHAEGILQTLAPHPELWTYRTDEAPANRAEAIALVKRLETAPAITLAVMRPGDDSFQGMVSIQRVDIAQGNAEIGAIIFSPDLQRTPATTEATHLIATYLFCRGFRRFEWKCDSLNEPSRRAALRLGFTEEGTFRNALVYKNRSRDTTWFSITDAEWPAIRAAHRAWLDPANFDADGGQRQRLADLLREQQLAPV